MLFGAHAVAIHVAPRATRDIDVTVAIDDAALAPFVASLTGGGFEARARDPVAFALATSVVPVFHMRTHVPVDIVIAGTEAEEVALSRAERVAYLGVELPVMSAEDLVVFKLSSERPRDYEDARSVIAARADELDLDVVRSGLKARELLFDRDDLVREFDAMIARYRGPDGT